MKGDVCAAVLACLDQGVWSRIVLAWGLHRAAYQPALFEAEAVERLVAAGKAERVEGGVRPSAKWEAEWKAAQWVPRLA